VSQTQFSDQQIIQSAGYFLPCVRRFAGQDPVVFVEAQGAVLKDQTGREYIDLLGSHGCTSLVGYNHPAVVEAIKRQVGQISCVSCEFPTKPVIALADKLIQITPEPLKRVFFGNAGTEVVETALFLAKKFSGLYEFVSLYGEFHGRSSGSRSLLGWSPLKKGMGPLLPGVCRIPSYYCYRCQLGLEYPSCDLRCARMLEDALMYDTSGDVALFVAESMQGTAGNIPAPDGYFEIVKQILDKHGIPIFLDEIFTAFGSTGKMFCCEHYGFTPDMMTMSKTLAAGYPISALVTTEELAASFAEPEPPQYFTTFGGNPLMATAALATLEIIVEEQPWIKAAESGQYWMAGLKKLQDKYEIIGDVRGLGIMIGVELVKDRQTKEPAKKESLKFKAEAFKRGLIAPAGQGWFGSTIRMVPTVVMTKEQIDRALDIMDQSFQAIS